MRSNVPAPLRCRSRDEGFSLGQNLKTRFAVNFENDVARLQAVCTLSSGVGNNQASFDPPKDHRRRVSRSVTRMIDAAVTIMQLRHHSSQSIEKGSFIRVVGSGRECVSKSFWPVSLHYVKVRIEVLEYIPGERHVCQTGRAIVTGRFHQRCFRSYRLRCAMRQCSFRIGEECQRDKTRNPAAKTGHEWLQWIRRAHWYFSSRRVLTDTLAFIRRELLRSLLPKALVTPGNDLQRRDALRSFGLIRKARTRIRWKHTHRRRHRPEDLFKSLCQ